ncbi:hypothetical protein CYLTODRAFT_415460 [Cylindrobasidium torrendii FP15055 ss-10]|uniref:Uncharacterized protein n=1 Tax=Cylindrobasidium torrendii FP15055 ss-10 TaxID=1314674 RepID=A0A0D7ATR7_9AGAR|nr:hypothetical protein CYLTODRAFT_415460 [Cylindrobasidium torrendii FP15055 ss-10]
MRNLVQTTANIGALQASIGNFEQCSLRANLQPPAPPVDTLSDLSELSDDETPAHPPPKTFSRLRQPPSSSELRVLSPPPSNHHSARPATRSTRKKLVLKAQKPSPPQSSSSSVQSRNFHPQKPRASPHKASSNVVPHCETRPIPRVTPAQKQSSLQEIHISNSLPLPPPPPAFHFTLSTTDSEPSAPKKRRTKPQTEEAIAKAKAKKNAYRTRRRRLESRFHGLKDSWLKHMHNARVYMLPNFDITDTRCGVGGWRGSSSNVYEAPHTLAEAIAQGFDEFEWDGNTTVVFLDRNRRFIVLLRKKDNSPAGLARQERMTTKLKEEAGRALLKGKMGQGDFNALRDGLVHNQGTHVPSRVFNNQTNTRVLQRIFSDEDFVYESHQTDIALRMWNPALHQALWDVREALSSQPETEDLPWPYEHSPYTLTTVNFGPQTVCKTHRDHADFAFLMSVLKAFGPYDYRKGGHIVLPTLRLAIQFPQGAEAYFPTARLPHANTQIAPHETRYSVTSYSGGGLFEWCYRGGLSKTGWLDYLAKYEKAAEEAELDRERPALLTDRFFPVWT